MFDSDTVPRGGGAAVKQRRRWPAALSRAPEKHAFRLSGEVNGGKSPDRERVVSPTQPHSYVHFTYVKNFTENFRVVDLRAAYYL